MQCSNGTPVPKEKGQAGGSGGQGLESGNNNKVGVSNERTSNENRAENVFAVLKSFWNEITRAKTLVHSNRSVDATL